jgi:hypothetical protein
MKGRALKKRAGKKILPKSNNDVPKPLSNKTNERIEAHVRSSVRESKPAD